MADMIPRDVRLIQPKATVDTTLLPTSPENRGTRAAERLRTVESDRVNATAKAAEAPAAAEPNGQDAGPAQPGGPVSLQVAPNTRLVILYDKDIDRFVYQGVDLVTGEVVNEYPAEDARRQLAAFRELTGLTVDSKV